MKNTHAVVPVREFKSPATQSWLQKVEEQVEQFQRLLNDESALMKVRNADGLSELVSRKNAAIAELTKNEQFLIHLFKDHGDESSVAALREQLAACRELNRLNKVVALSELNATRKSLDLLRSLQRMDDLPLYGAEGKIKVAREKRNLGEA